VSDKGIVLLGEDKAIRQRAKAAKLAVTVDAAMPLAYDKTLFMTPGTRVPWDLLPAAWHFLERWDAAVPLWRYGVLAADVGTKEERKRTEAIVRDLRVLLHSYELLFVRDNELGRALLRTWEAEKDGDSEPRLAFLRAVYQVKPRLCVLPRTWLACLQEGRQAEATQRGTCLRRQARAAAMARSTKQGTPRRPARGQHTPRGTMIRLEVTPGRFVRCNSEDVEKVKEMYENRRGRRRR